MSDYRVLHLLPDLAVGGGQVMVLRLSKRMRKKGVGVLVASYGSCNDMSAQFQRAGIRVVELGLGGLRDLPKAVSQLGPHLKDQDVSIVHTHGTPADKMLGHALSKRYQLAHVTTLHGMPPAYDVWSGPLRSRLRGAYQNTIFNIDWWLAAGRLHGAVAVSNAVRDAWAPMLDNMHRSGSFDERVIHWGVESETFCEIDHAERLRLRDEIAGERLVDGPIILCVSRLEASKNVDLLPEAMAFVVQHWPNAVLGIVGDGPERQPLERAVAALGLHQNVRFLGRRDDVPLLLAATDISVFPSHVEGFGLVVLESLAAGTPVVSFDLPSLKALRADVDAIWTASDRSAAGLGATLCRALDDPKIESLGNDARKTILQSWTLDQTAASYDRFYRSVVSGKIN